MLKKIWVTVAVVGFIASARSFSDDEPIRFPSPRPYINISREAASFIDHLSLQNPEDRSPYRCVSGVVGDGRFFLNKIYLHRLEGTLLLDLRNMDGSPAPYRINCLIDATIADLFALHFSVTDLYEWPLILLGPISERTPLRELYSSDVKLVEL